MQLGDDVLTDLTMSARIKPLTGDDADVQAGAWQTLTVTVIGDTMQAFFEGDLIVELEDSTFSAGHVGLWTKADSVTCFDRVTVMAQ